MSRYVQLQRLLSTFSQSFFLSQMVFSQTGGCHTSPPLMGKLMINHINHEICWACPAFVFKPQQTHPITGSPCEPWIWPKEGDCGCDLHGLWLAILPWQDLLQLNSLTDYQMAGRSAVSTCTRWCLRQFSILSHLQLWEVSGAVLFAYFEDSIILFPNLGRCLSQSPSETFDVQVFRSWFIYIFIYILYIYMSAMSYISYLYIYIYIYPRIGMANAARNHKKSLYLVGKNVACDFPSKKCNNIMNPVINPNISQHLRHDIGGKKTGHGWWRYKDFNRPDPNNHKFSIKDYKGIWHV